MKIKTALKKHWKDIFFPCLLPFCGITLILQPLKTGLLVTASCFWVAFVTLINVCKDLPEPE